MDKRQDTSKRLSIEEWEARKGLGVPRQLFVPGDGMVPPHVAGRTEEQKVLMKLLDLLSEGTAPAHNAAVHGPRGLGKTALLEKLAQGAARTHPRVKTVQASASEMPGLRELYEITLGEVVPEGAVIASETKGGLNTGVASVGGAKAASKTLPSMSAYEWRMKLAEKCREQPLLLMVDEAHTLDLDVAKVLLNASQSIRKSRAPFALVVAGTPGMQAHLNQANATFWTRLGKGEMQLGLLSEGEASDALSVPMRNAGIPFDGNAVEEMALCSDGYPYFVQIWGEAVTDFFREHGGCVDMKVVESVRADVEKSRRKLYAGRVNELRRAGLMGCMKQLAPAFAAEGVVEHDRVLAEINPTSEQGAQETVDRLLELGVLQSDGDGGELTAGIPSFINHIIALGQAERSAKAKREAGLPSLER